MRGPSPAFWSPFSTNKYDKNHLVLSLLKRIDDGLSHQSIITQRIGCEQANQKGKDEKKMFKEIKKHKKDKSWHSGGIGVRTNGPTDFQVVIVYLSGKCYI